jgi:curved DNA-binding protein
MSVQYKDYYKILGISRDASDKEIKSTYRKLARQHHPDVNPGSADKFKEINEAYEVLGDPDKRRRYDSLGTNWQHGAGFNPPPGFEQFHGGTTVEFGDLGDLFRGAGGMGGFSDFFEALFGGGGLGGRGASANYQTSYQTSGGTRSTSARQSTRSTQHLDMEHPLPLTLEEVAQGTEKHINIRGKSVTVKIPQGVRPDSKIRLANQGNPGPGGTHGDLYLVVQYQKHPYFSVDGLDLSYEAQMPVPDLVLGTEIQIPTLTGGRVTVTVPAGSQPDRILRLRDRGLPSKDGKSYGHLLVRLKAQLPELLSEREKTLYQELKKLAHAR